MSAEPTTTEQPQAPVATVATEEHIPVDNATMPTEAASEEPSSTTKPSEAQPTIVGGEPAPVPAPKDNKLENNKSEAVVEATPASEGVLGYKGPGLLSKFRFAEHFFWLSGEPVSLGALSSYVGSKDKTAHANAAWATQSGKGLLFYAKRQEDKSVPHGIINLSEATPVIKEGFDLFYFKTNGSKHEFKATSVGQRNSWVVAIEKQIEHATGMKDEITNSAGYKKHMDQSSKAPAVGAATAAHKKSATRDPTQASDATSKNNHAGEEVAAAGAGAAAVGGVAAHEKKDENSTTKSRSQSRKRSSVFSSFLGKKDKDPEQKELKKEEKSEDKAEKKLEKDAAKEEKQEKKAEKKQEKEAIKEEKKEEKAEKKEIVQEQKAEQKEVKEEEKAEDKAEKKQNKEIVEEEKKQNEECHKAEVAGTAAASAAIAADDKKRHEATNETTKKGKRASVFGSIFGKKSPTTEKSESDAGPSVPAKDNGEVPPVSATAPKIEEPAATQPIDAAAVTAPVDTVQTPRAVEEPKKEPGTTETAAISKKEKSGLVGTIMSKLEGKKPEQKKLEQKEEKAPQTNDPVAASPESPANTNGSAVAASSETEARPSPREGRRSSLFGSLGTMKRKNNATSDNEAGNVDTKREKSPVASKIGGLFRKPSKAVKPTASEAPATTETAPAPVAKDEPAIAKDEPAVAKDEPAIAKDDSLTNGTSHTETPAMANGEQSAEAPSSTIHNSVTQAPEIESSA